MAGMRRSEVSALLWADVVESTDGDGMLVTVQNLLVGHAVVPFPQGRCGPVDVTYAAGA